MKKVFLSIALLLFGAMHANAADDFTLTSPQIQNNSTLGQAQVYNSFGCTGKNISPELKWKNAPADTKAFAVTMYDPDAPTGSGWWQWIVYNIPATATGLDQAAGDDHGKLPAGALQAINDYGFSGYGGACPPVGNKPHHYIFTVYALKAPLEIPPHSTSAYVGFFIHANTLAKAELTATYGR